MACILQDWVCQLGLRHQGTLLAGIRGCDTAPRNDPSKLLVRCLRNEILIPFCGNPAKSASFIEAAPLTILEHRMQEVVKNHDHYPSHYVGHLILCAEIIGYKKPSSSWLAFYFNMVHSYHLLPETERELDTRLNADEETFGQAQNH